MEWFKALFSNTGEMKLTGLFLAIVLGTYLTMEVFSFRFFNIFGTVHKERQEVHAVHTIYHK